MGVQKERTLSLIVFLNKAAPTTDGPQKEIRKERIRLYRRIHSHYPFFLLEFCFGRSYSV